MGASSSPATKSIDGELFITRVFDAPRHLVFKVWTVPEQLARWWGPRGFTLPSCNMDLRPGGAYRFHMHSPEGTDYWMRGVYREIVEPERLVMTSSSADADGKPTSPEKLITVTFEEQDAKTQVTVHQAVFETVAARDVARQGWTGSLDRLAEYLAA